MEKERSNLKWVYFLSVISVNQCSINNDFEGIRLNSDGIIYTTDVSRKYLMKRYMKYNLGLKIAGLPDKNKQGMYSYLKDNSKLIQTLETTSKDTEKQLKTMCEFKDVNMFGYLFTDTFGKSDEKSLIQLSNSTLTGYLQVSNGINIGQKNDVINMTIINGNKTKETTEENKSGSIGSKQIIEEAYILNTIFINPNQYKENFDLFSEEKDFEKSYDNDISIIEKTLSNDANSFRTSSRNNIFNEVLIKIESDSALNLGKTPLIIENNKIILSKKIKELEKTGTIKIIEILNESK